MKICKDGRIWGQNNKGASNHLGILKPKKQLKYTYYNKNVGKIIGHATRYKKGTIRLQTKEERLKRSQTLKNMRTKLWMWKGGITPLTVEIYNTIEYREWRKKIFIRDLYTCQKCGQKGGRLQAHHNKGFSKLLQDFLKLYNQFSPIEDKETLVRLAIKYKPFWDVDNGRTLCNQCHKSTSNYGKKKEGVMCQI